MTRGERQHGAAAQRGKRKTAATTKVREVYYFIYYSTRIYSNPIATLFSLSAAVTLTVSEKFSPRLLCLCLGLIVVCVVCGKTEYIYYNSIIHICIYMYICLLVEECIKTIVIAYI